jgi:hypothetical protein
MLAGKLNLTAGCSEWEVFRPQGLAQPALSKRFGRSPPVSSRSATADRSRTCAVNDTPVADNTYSPTWSSGGCVVPAGTLLQGGVAYQVVDDDVIGSDPITAKISVSVTEANLLAGAAIVAPSDGLTGLTISLQKQ